LPALWLSIRRDGLFHCLCGHNIIVAAAAAAAAAARSPSIMAKFHYADFPVMSATNPLKLKAEVKAE